jgi:hypothetical protein
MKTAVEWLEENINEFNWEQVFKQAKQKEEEQIREAYILGHYDSSLDIYNPSECYGEIKNQNK